MCPTLLTIGNLAIPAYTVVLDLGLILGLVLAYVEGRRRLGGGEVALDAGLWAIIGGILGGRVGYVVANWDLFSSNLVEAVQIWKGGLSFHGAFLGGVLVLGVVAWFRRKSPEAGSFWILADVVAPSLAVGTAFGWLACLLGSCSGSVCGSCAYGAQAEGFGTLTLPDLYGVELQRYAVQWFGMGWSLVLLVGLWLMRRRWPFAGAAFLMFGLLYFGGQFFLEFWRGDETLYLDSWRLGQIIDGALVLLFAAGLLLLWWRAPREAGEEPGALAEEPAEPEVEAPSGEVGAPMAEVLPEEPTAAPAEPEPARPLEETHVGPAGPEPESSPEPSPDE
jgi:phosphatidylglycerol:prolipoprotein diacylglycerol transferase